MCTFHFAPSFLSARGHPTHILCTPVIPSDHRHVLYTRTACITNITMVLSLNYRRPVYVDSSNVSVETEKSQGESVSSASSCPYGIPEALSFEKIITGGTCPVRTFNRILVPPDLTISSL